MKILIDNGHGIDTKGKRSPDGRLLEYAQNRLLAGRIVSALQARGLDASLLVPEETDISLPERCRRVNEWCRQLGKANVLLISIHCNAAGRGDRWLSARGWCAYTTRGNTRADALATSLYTAACPPLSTLSTPPTGVQGGQRYFAKITLFQLCENWLRVVGISLHQEKQCRSTITDKMAGEGDRNGI